MEALVWTSLLSLLCFLIFTPGCSPASVLTDTKHRRLRRSLCPPGCVDCDDVNGCVACTRDRFLFLDQDELRQYGLCLRSCPNGYYENKVDNKCTRCVLEACGACLSQSYCTHCNPPYLLHQGHCVRECPQGLRYDSFTKACVRPVSCEVGPWSPWGPCTRQGAQCGYKYGVQTRTRSVLLWPHLAGVATDFNNNSTTTVQVQVNRQATPCPDLSQSVRCRMKHRYCPDEFKNYSDPWTNEIPQGDPSFTMSNQRRTLYNEKHRKANKKRKQRQQHKRRRRKKSRHLVTSYKMLPDLTTNSLETLPKTRRLLS